MLRAAGVHQLTERSTVDVLRALNKDPLANCMVAARVEAYGASPSRLGAALWSVDDPTRSLCYSGANLIPVYGSRDALAVFAERARRQPRVCSALVGAAELVLPMWEMLTEWWGPARDVRPRQPLLVLPGAPRISSDPLVRRVAPGDLDSYLPAAVAMFTEEVGVDPTRVDGGRHYRRRVQEVIAEGRAFARFDDGEVTFKAEVGARSARVGQIQGVWVRPDRRGTGLATAATAAVADFVRTAGRTPSLYVNDYNTAARRVYDRIGFTQIATFATVLLH